MAEERWRADAEARLASLAKPPGALGTLEDWCVTLCVAQKTLRPTVSTAALVFCGDHGCKKADAALSPYPASATQAIFRSLAAGVSCAAVLARSAGATWASARGPTTTRSWTSKYKNFIKTRTTTDAAPAR